MPDIIRCLVLEYYWTSMKISIKGIVKHVYVQIIKGWYSTNQVRGSTSSFYKISVHPCLQCILIVWFHSFKIWYFIGVSWCYPLAHKNTNKLLNVVSAYSLFSACDYKNRLETEIMTGFYKT